MRLNQAPDDLADPVLQQPADRQVDGTREGFDFWGLEPQLRHSLDIEAQALGTLDDAEVVQVTQGLHKLPWHDTSSCVWPR